MNIEKISKDPRAIKALIGMPYQEFTALIPTFQRIMLEEQAKRQKREIPLCNGIKGHLPTIESKLFFVLFYLKTYPTFDVLAYISKKSRGRSCEAIQLYMKILEKTLKRKLVLPVRKIRSVEEFLTLFPGEKEIFLDGTERRIQRPKDSTSQKKHYSGKKKTHTRKNMVITNSKKEILVLTPTKSGRRHDKYLADKFELVKHVPETVLIGVDSGLQGIQKIHSNTWLPHKGTKKNPLSVKQKEENTILSHFRVSVEHAIGGMKRFRAMTDVLRNRIGLMDDCIALVSAGLWNYHQRFVM
jgi:hypothetical protein